MSTADITLGAIMGLSGEETARKRFSRCKLNLVDADINSWSCLVNSPERLCWEVKETTYVQEVYGQTDREDNAYKWTYTRAQDEVTYIDVYWWFRFRFRFCFRFRFRVCLRFHFRRTRYCRFRFSFRLCFRRTRYFPVRTNSHTQVVRLRNIDRLCQTGVSSCKWSRKLTSVQ